MKVMKNANLILCVIVITGILTQNALALPYSTYGSENGWQGYKSYNKDGVNMTVVFNVYDTVANPTEFTWNGGAAMPDTDRYIYAYQITNNSDSQDISVFNLLDKSKNPLAQQLMHSTCSQSDGSSLSVAPDPAVSTQQGIWEWTASGGLLSAGKNSWYLIFSSDNAPTKGSFEVEAASQTEPPVPTPEPGTLALLGIASAMFAAKRGKKRQAG
jgi:PEP-CTERM putative exosortase interaction domain